jgi:DNA primase catalytic subunit
MMDLRKVYEYYSREDIQNFLLEFGKDREVVGVFRNGNFSQRPNVLLYQKDITAMVKTGVIEFHGSLERWSQPMSLRSDNYEQLRKGWDLIFDLDCKLFEHGKIAAEAFIWGLKKHDIRSVSVKFTGGTGFHIGVPWEAIPKTVDYKPSVSLYPELARKIVMYLRDFVFERLERNLFKKFTAEEISGQINKPLGKILTDDGMNVYEVVDVDPVLISPRHLFRLPYSLNGKSFLASLPVKPERLEGFEKMQARPDTVKVENKYLEPGEDGEAELLIAETIDWFMRAKKKIEERSERRLEITRPIPVESFPPCIKNIMNGLSDGRKRSIFILLNFLRSSKWTWDEIEKFLIEWNSKNKPPLRESYIRSHLRWHRARNKEVLPPNCANEGWYKNFGVCKPDEKCSKIKNPVNYAIRSMTAARQAKAPAAGRKNYRTAKKGK